MAHYIVVGNEKGGSGKSTTAMHLATALARMGHRVAAIDLDLRQRSLARYLENRLAYNAREGADLAMPLVGALAPQDPVRGESDDERLAAAVAGLEQAADFIVMDCPGSHTPLSQYAHSLADTLVTPMNDSFVDFDLLARVDGATGRITGPSIYSEMVWKARQWRSGAGLPAMDWVVMRNRLGQTFMHNKRKVGEAMEQLSRRIGFRVIPGFSERVIFRELFPQGLTLLDLAEMENVNLRLSHLAARQELRGLISTLDLPGVTVDF